MYSDCIEHVRKGQEIRVFGIDTLYDWQLSKSCHDSISEGIC